MRAAHTPLNRLPPLPVAAEFVEQYALEAGAGEVCASKCGGGGHRADWRCRHPRTFDKGCLHVARPRRHRDAQKPQCFRPGAAVLEGGTDRDVDGDTRRQNGHFFPALVPAPNLPPARQDVPELAHRGMDGRPVHLPWRNRGMDHGAGCAPDQGADLRPGGGAGIGGLGKRAGLRRRSFAGSSSTAYAVRLSALVLA